MIAQCPCDGIIFWNGATAIVSVSPDFPIIIEETWHEAAHRLGEEGEREEARAWTGAKRKEFYCATWNLSRSIPRRLANMLLLCADPLSSHLRLKFCDIILSMSDYPLCAPSLLFYVIAYAVGGPHRSS